MNHVRSYCTHRSFMAASLARSCRTSNACQHVMELSAAPQGSISSLGVRSVWLRLKPALATTSAAHSDSCTRAEHV